VVPWPDRGRPLLRLWEAVMSDRPAGVKATRSPWTDGAWIMRCADVPDGWEWRDDTSETEWDDGRRSEMWAACIVEARPVGGES
jgi:hypothetical protein